MLNLLLKDIGELNYFLGIQVEHTIDGGLHLNQSKYITDLICRAKMQNAKRLPTPMFGGKKLSKIGSDLVLLGHYSMQQLLGLKLLIQ